MLFDNHKDVFFFLFCILASLIVCMIHSILKSEFVAVLCMAATKRSWRLFILNKWLSVNSLSAAFLGVLGSSTFSIFLLNWRIS